MVDLIKNGNLRIDTNRHVWLRKQAAVHNMHVLRTNSQGYVGWSVYCIQLGIIAETIKIIADVRAPEKFNPVSNVKYGSGEFVMNTGKR